MKKTGIMFIVVLLLYLRNYTFVDVNLDQYKKEVIRVEIKGEVQQPGVYDLKYDATISDLIDKAKGLSDQADTSSLNMAKALHDQDVIVIMAKTGKNKISLNAASKEELMNLQGIGSATADKIIAYRKENGSFQKLEELMNIKGIKEKTFSKLKDDICL